VIKNLNALRDGIQTLKRYSSELQSDLVKKVNETSSILEYQTKQLKSIEFDDPAFSAAVDAIRTHLKADRPWIDISEIEGDIATVKEAYKIKRADLLGGQEQQTEVSRGRIKKRAGYSTLTADQSEAVLREFQDAETNTSTEAISPPLLDLRDAFQVRLQRCEAAADQKLDEILSEKDKKIVRPVSLSYRNRIINTPDDIEKLVEEIRKELLNQLEANITIRIM